MKIHKETNELNKSNGFCNFATLHLLNSTLFDDFLMYQVIFALTWVYYKGQLLQTTCQEYIKGLNGILSILTIIYRIYIMFKILI